MTPSAPRRIAFFSGSTLPLGLALVRASLQQMFAYRATMVLWAIWGVVTPLVTLAVWSTAAGPKPIAGYTREQFAAYFILAMVMNHFTACWDMEVFGWMVQHGRLSAKLLRPMLPIWDAVADNVAWKLMTGVVVAPAWVVVGSLVHSDWSGVTATSIALSVPAVGLAAALNFVWGYCIAMVAFWTTKNSAINHLYWFSAWSLGGRIAPLPVLPPFIQRLAAVLPFPLMFSFPIQLAMGRVAPEQVGLGFALQFAWLAVGLVLWKVVWRVGLRNYSAVGA